MVGMRHPDKEFDRFAEKLVTDVRKAGIGVVSGAAIGIDHMCHSYCVKARGETWGFLGSALDEIE